MALPSPALLKRKIIIKNKKKHQHHRTHKDQDRGATGGASALAATIGSVSGAGGVLLPGQQGNGEIPRPRLEKEESKESITEEDDAIIHGEASLKKKMSAIPIFAASTRYLTDAVCFSLPRFVSLFYLLILVRHFERCSSGRD